MSKFEFRQPRVDASSLKSLNQQKDSRLNITIDSLMLKKLKQIALDRNMTLKMLITNSLSELLNE